MTGDKKKKPKVKIGHIIAISLGIIAGIIIRFSKKTYLMDTDTHLRFILLLVVLIIIFVIGYLFSIIVHEAGHLLFGLLSGYTFVSFRIGNIVLKKEDGKFKRKKFSIPGTGGQCLMMPPDVEPQECPYFLYNLGGVLMNLIFSILFTLLMIFVSMPDIVMYIILMFTITEYLSFLINILPIKINGIATDGYNLLSLGKDLQARESFCISLKVNGMNYRGTRMKEIPLKWLILRKNANLGNPINTLIRMMEGDWYFDNKRFDRAKKSYESLLDKDLKILEFYENQIKCELLFIEIMEQCRQTEIEKYNTEELKTFMKQTKNYLSCCRTKFAYELFVNKDKIAAQQRKEEFEENCLIFPKKGEVISETDMMKYIEELEKNGKSEYV